MIRLFELILGLVAVFIGLYGFSGADKMRGLVFGLLAIGGLALVIYGVLLYDVPQFFEPSLW
jgi:hypothetical protein